MSIEFNQLNFVQPPPWWSWMILFLIYVCPPLFSLYRKIRTKLFIRKIKRNLKI